ncbi:hypothetical protein [Actinophytocola sp.]|uniref:hypothetical protein n=1 Tax=Actinophytocola sp. TaxID=1872138 RepID=UPI002D24E3B2|nr:hypothetical protein [Actinophytocola sp.]HYQ68780.1 hypothetical protein [Actinophytocola sp.]
MALWVELPHPSATRIASTALDLGLRITPGPRFIVDGTADRWLRLPFTLAAHQADTVAGLLREASLRSASPPNRDLHVPRWTACPVASPRSPSGSSTTDVVAPDGESLPGTGISGMRALVRLLDGSPPTSRAAHIRAHNEGQTTRR